MAELNGRSEQDKRRCLLQRHSAITVWWS